MSLLGYLHGGLSDSHQRKDVGFPTYTTELHPHVCLVEVIGFEPMKAKLTDLQSVSFNHSETPPKIFKYYKFNGAGERS